VRERELMLAGLRRLLEEPGVRLFGGGRMRGVFAQRTTLAERAAGLLLEHRLLEADADGASCRLTPEGLKWLAENDDSKVLLEDLLRASENQQERLRRIETLCREEADRLAQQRAAVAAVLDRLTPDGDENSEGAGVDGWLLDCLKNDGGADPASAAELFRRAADRGLRLTIGQFHDALRRLHEQRAVRLAPWTGPLYDLPEPALALLVGHEVLYYVEPTEPTARRRAG
jgi:hypothetical protein